MKHVALVLCLTGLLGFAAGAQAQAIYRCGSNGTEYSQTPCPGGKVLESSDSRSAAQRVEAVRVAAQDRRQAAELERARREQQASTPAAKAGSLGGRPVPPEASASATERGTLRKKSKKSKLAKGADTVFVEPGSAKQRKRK